MCSLTKPKCALEPTVTGHSETASIFEQRPFDQTQSHTPATATLTVANVVELLKLLLADDVGNILPKVIITFCKIFNGLCNKAEPDLAAHLSPWIGPSLAHELAKIQLAPNTSNRPYKVIFLC